MVNHLPILRSDQTSVRLPFRLNQPITIRSRFVRLLVSFKKNGARAFRVLTPTLVALSFAGVAHAQGTMDFSGAQTLMGTFKTTLLKSVREAVEKRGYVVEGFAPTSRAAN